MTRYVTVGDSMGQATVVYAAIVTLPDGTTVSDIPIQAGESVISIIGSAATVDGAWTADVGNNITLKLSGKAMVDGDQVLTVASLVSSEVGTSVTGALTLEPAFYQPVNIRVREGHLNLSAAHDGTSPGVGFIAITLGID